MRESSAFDARRSIAAAITLFFVSPLVAEFLLGDFSIAQLWLLLVLAPMYGGGALLIRETARRSGRGWPTMLLLGAAYALAEEGFSTQSLFNAHYLGMNLLRFAWIPALGIGGFWTLLMLNVHVFWSMGASIALVEGLFPSRARTPWLGSVGTAVAAVLFVAGGVNNAVYSIRQSHFHASAMQFTATALLGAALIAAAFLRPRSSPKEQPGWTPTPWIAGTGALVLGAAVMLTPPRWNWGACAAMLAADLLFLVLLGVFSRRRGWTALHTLSVGGGAAILYGARAFTTKPVLPSPAWAVRSGHIVFLALALACIAIGALRTRSWMAAERGREDVAE